MVMNENQRRKGSGLSILIEACCSVVDSGSMDLIPGIYHYDL
jgi:hypothetical protein